MMIRTNITGSSKTKKPAVAKTHRSSKKRMATIRSLKHNQQFHHVHGKKLTIPSLVKNDIRRAYANMFANSFNLHDESMISDFLLKFCRPNVAMTTVCGHAKEFKLPSVLELEGPQLIFEFWHGRMVQFPDTVFRILESKVRTRYMPDSMECVGSTIEADFCVTGTWLYQLRLEEWLPSLRSYLQTKEQRRQRQEFQEWQQAERMNNLVNAAPATLRGSGNGCATDNYGKSDRSSSNNSSTNSLCSKGGEAGHVSYLENPQKQTAGEQLPRQQQQQQFQQQEQQYPCGPPGSTEIPKANSLDPSPQSEVARGFRTIPTQPQPQPPAPLYPTESYGQCSHVVPLSAFHPNVSSGSCQVEAAVGRDSCCGVAGGGPYMEQSRQQQWQQQQWHQQQWQQQQWQQQQWQYQQQQAAVGPLMGSRNRAQGCTLIDFATIMHPRPMAMRGKMILEVDTNLKITSFDFKSQAVPNGACPCMDFRSSCSSTDDD